MQSCFSVKPSFSWSWGCVVLLLSWGRDNCQNGWRVCKMVLKIVHNSLRWVRIVEHGPIYIEIILNCSKTCQNLELSRSGCISHILLHCFFTNHYYSWLSYPNLTVYCCGQSPSVSLSRHEITRLWWSRYYCRGTAAILWQKFSQTQENKTLEISLFIYKVTSELLYIILYLQ